MEKKLHSRKFWITVGTYALVVIGAVTHYFSSGQTAGVMGLVGSVYIAIQGQIDKGAL